MTKIFINGAHVTTAARPGIEIHIDACDRMYCSGGRELHIAIDRPIAGVEHVSYELGVITIITVPDTGQHGKA